MSNNGTALVIVTTTYGFALLTLMGVNLTTYFSHRDRLKIDGHSSSLGRSAWRLSFVSLFLLVLAPVALGMALFDLTRSHPDRPRHDLLPSKMALLNSLVAASYLVVIMLALFVFEWL
ncbi:MAG: hypothetical protein MI919_20280 [Holophagales bacterium]|nr:hypothetical protein [Holophagales bacterium]